MYSFINIFICIYLENILFKMFFIYIYIDTLNVFTHFRTRILYILCTRRKIEGIEGFIHASDLPTGNRYFGIQGVFLF